MSTDTDNDETTQVAIACQGGGSHTAFTAGVLKRLFLEAEQHPSRYEFVALSGTSGGAVCAAAAWYGLLADGERHAIETLEAIWEDMAAHSVVDRATNDWLVRSHEFSAQSGLMVQTSPYAVPLAFVGRDKFLRTLRAHIDFDQVHELVEASTTDLIVGAADVKEGEFTTFHNEEVTAEAILASAAIPTLFEAVEIVNRWYWDGLFSQNPPIRDFLTMPGNVDEKPDEIWIIQINPTRRDEVPTSIEEIDDRRNELSGNLSLFQEVDFIKRVNDWLEKGQLSGAYKPIDIEFISLEETLSTASKLDRDPAFLKRLMRQGEQQAERFLEKR